jgi:hypothetical protein
LEVHLRPIVCYLCGLLRPIYLEETKMNSSFDAVVAVATKFASDCGLPDVAVLSREPFEEGGNTFEIWGDLSISTEGMSPEDEDTETLKELLAGGFRLRVVVCNGEVRSHEWVGVQLS